MPGVCRLYHETWNIHADRYGWAERQAAEPAVPTHRQGHANAVRQNRVELLSYLASAACEGVK